MWNRTSLNCRTGTYVDDSIIGAFCDRFCNKLWFLLLCSLTSLNVGRGRDETNQWQDPYDVWTLEVIDNFYKRSLLAFIGSSIHMAQRMVQRDFFVLSRGKFGESHLQNCPTKRQHAANITKV
jgi:hypothetical protein